MLRNKHWPKDHSGSKNPKAYFNSVFEQLNDAVAITTLYGEVLVSNEKFYHFARETSFPLPMLSLAAPSLEKSGKHEFVYREPNGTWRVAIHKITNDFGEQQLLWQASFDASEQLRRKTQILKSLYRSFIDTTFELIFKTTVQGDLLFANRLFVSNFGYTHYKKIKGTNLEHFFEEPELFKQLRAEVMMHGRVIERIVHFRKSDNSRLTGLVNGSLQPGNQSEPAINWAILNVSRQVESESALKKKNDELAKVNLQMEKFLYSTSHDLRSPITSILGLINLVRMESQPASIIDYISKIETSTLKLDKIIRDIMSFSRTSYQRLSSEKIDFETLVWKSIQNHKGDPALRKIHSEVTLKGSFPFFNDIDRIEIIVENIIRNAVHFYDVNKARPFIRVNIIIEKDQAKLEFIDNGIGIGHDHLDHIFTMFYKASHHSKGAGLGLFIVKETLEKLSGTIEVESEIGFGTVMRVTIPNDHKGRLISRKLELQKGS